MYTLYRDSPYVEMTWSTTNKRATMQAEGGWLAFPFRVEQPTFRLGRTGAVVNPAADFVKNTNHDYFFLNTGMAVLDKQQWGYGLNTPQAPAVSLDRMGLTRFSGQFVPRRPNVFVNLYNTQWGTNFTEYIDGTLSATVYLWGFDRYDNEASLITPVEETRVPLMAAFADTPEAGLLPTTASGITLSRRGVLVTAYQKGSAEAPALLRLWEQAGQDGKCEVTLPKGSPYRTAQYCNLRSEPIGEPFAVRDGKLKLQTKAYQPLSLLLR